MNSSQTTLLEVSDNQKKKLTFLVCLILAFTVMNSTMFNVAIPDISSDFNLSTSQVSWVMTGYILVFAIGSLMYGKLADLFPIRTLFTFGLALFSFGALLGLLSPSFEVLILARVLQAMGGASIPALSFIIPSRFMPSIRGRVFGYVASTVAFASGVGPILGGIIGGAFSWRFLFFFSMLAVFSIPLFRKWLPMEERKRGSIDLLGAALIALTAASLLFFITTFDYRLIGLFVLFALLFIWRTVKAKDPFIQPAILKNRRYTVTVISSFFGTACLFGLIFVIPIMLRDLNTLSTIGIGFVLFPGAIMAGFLGQYGGRVIDKKGGVPVVKTALVLIAAGCLLISTFAGSGAWIISLCMLVAYIGFPLIQSSTADLLSTTLSSEQNGVGIGIFNLLNFMGGAFSSAIFGAVLEIQDVTFRWNLLADSGLNVIYSNLFISLSLLAILNVIMFSILYKRADRSAQAY
ncbi:MFS transporter [Jeotgalibacillus proteolyticus]|uniref:MFS transporter n=1 Tax=Jeotgalibacillus proteolyticus TaxID=2082395 RepID=A0A2S5G9R8_9BACL|nr:MFS transporter [Jeotgalibacillus proteolyticus]PPA69736.1 MFS transporter [Jeotgalibacillus proteolyticus]